MNKDSRVSVALHVLLHMSEHRSAVTSEAIGTRMAMNPVVIRRTLGALREAGIVAAVKGHGGGWTITRDLRTVTIADVYEAIAPNSLFGIGPHDPETKCVIERAVNRAVGEALADAEALVMKRLRGVVVADLLHEAARSRAARKD